MAREVEMPEGVEVPQNTGPQGPENSSQPQSPNLERIEGGAVDLGYLDDIRRAYLEKQQQERRQRAQWAASPPQPTKPEAPEDPDWTEARQIAGDMLGLATPPTPGTVDREVYDSLFKQYYTQALHQIKTGRLRTEATSTQQATASATSDNAAQTGKSAIDKQKMADTGQALGNAQGVRDIGNSYRENGHAPGKGEANQPRQATEPQTAGNGRTPTKEDVESVMRATLGDQTLAEVYQEVIGSLTKNLSGEELAKEEAKIRRALERGYMGIYKVVGYKPGELKLKDPESGQEFTYDRNKTEHTDLLSVPDPDADESTIPERAREWLENNLRSFERNLDRRIDENTERSIRATINSEMDASALGFDFKERLLGLATARIKYHNSTVLARTKIEDFSSEFSDISAEEHRYILEEPGVNEALEKLIENEGAFFRANATKKVPNIRNDVRDALLAKGWAPAKATYQAEIATDFAIKALTNMGEAGYYDGIVVKTGVTYHDSAGNPIHMNGGFVSERVLRALYNVPTEDPNDLSTSLVSLYQRYTSDHWGDIDFGDPNTGSGGSLAGPNESPRAQKYAYYYNVFLQKPGTGKNRGKAESLRKSAFIPINSGVRFGILTSPAEKSILQIVGKLTLPDNPLTDGDRFNAYAKLRTWAPRTSTLAGGRSQFNDKGLQSFLNVPLKDPDILVYDSSEGNIANVMGNLMEIVTNTYGSLGEDERKEKTASLLDELFDYKNHPDRYYKDRFPWMKWRKDIYFKICEWAIDSNLITYQQGEHLIHKYCGSIKQADMSEIKHETGHELLHALGASLKIFTGGGGGGHH